MTEATNKRLGDLPGVCIVERRDMLAMLRDVPDKWVAIYRIGSKQLLWAESLRAPVLIPGPISTRKAVE